MSVKARRVTAAIAAALWAGWVAAFWSEQIDADVWQQVLTESLRMTAMMSSMVLVLGIMVAPVLATARVWREIGIKEQQKHCDVCPVSTQRAARLENIIPFRSFTRVDN